MVKQKHNGLFGKYRGLMILLMLFLLATISLDFTPSFLKKQTPEEKQEICYNGCIEDGWEHGEWLGYQICNCYNTTIKLKQKEK